MRTQHPSWEGIVPCFESGREYLDWIQNWMEWEGKVPEEIKFTSRLLPDAYVDNDPNHFPPVF